MQSQEATCRLTRPELIAILKDIDVTTDDATRKRMFERYFVADSNPPRCITTGCPFGEIGKHPASIQDDVALQRPQMLEDKNCCFIVCSFSSDIGGEGNV